MTGETVAPNLTQTSLYELLQCMHIRVLYGMKPKEIIKEIEEPSNNMI